MLDISSAPGIQSLQFLPSADRTATTQLLMNFTHDALSCIFDVADPSKTVTLDPPAWIPGWHTLVKPKKCAIHANRNDLHDLHHLVDDLFA